MTTRALRRHPAAAVKQGLQDEKLLSRVAGQHRLVVVDNEHLRHQQKKVSNSTVLCCSLSRDTAWIVIKAALLTPLT